MGDKNRRLFDRQCVPDGGGSVFSFLLSLYERFGNKFVSGVDERAGIAYNGAEKRERGSWMQARKRQIAWILCAVLMIALTGSLFCVARHGAHFILHGGNSLCAECRLTEACQQLLLQAGLILLAMALSLLRVHGQAAAAVRRHTLRPAPTLVALKVKLSD